MVSYRKVRSEFGSADKIYPYYQEALALGLSGDKKAKVSVLQEVTIASPDSPLYSEAMYELGRAYVSVGEPEDAVRTFRTLRSTTDDPAYATKALLELGMIARNGGDDAKALEYYKQVAVDGGEYADDALLAIESIYRTRQEPDAYLFHTL